MIDKIRKEKRYRVTIEEISPANESVQRLEFEHQDREDLFNTVEKIKLGTDLEPQTATKVAVALRLIGPVMMENRKHPLFSDLMPHFKSFMHNLKTSVKSKIQATNNA
ncbi:hypothetical protein BIY22_01145 [Vibrio panuliri]|uniref:DUF3861 domain-containing protein n=1 Tax=Vibrio panuliri TaxID=1381081 RepID=A0A1Q9HRV0_9VIBR|nr:DUF3861 domain-containing protein [Vibrio panuliri]OLQ93598.1 hypothetical protein BIY22_01145 [Vibrio panuliri]